MGKVRKVRQKYHLSLKKSKSLNCLPEVVQNNEETKLSRNLFKSTENIFAGVDISWNDINKSLSGDYDVKSIASTKSRRELKEEERHMKKKDKLKLRHERFLQKLNVAQEVLKKAKAKKKKKTKSTINGGDMSSLLDALPSLESLAAESHKKKILKSKLKPKGILKAKLRMKQQALDKKVFSRILNDKNYKANPMETISALLKQKVAHFQNKF